MVTMLITVEALTKTYGRGPTATHALAGVDLTLDAGSTAIMGPSGSGKTTLLHCLAGIVVPTSGRVVHGGRDLAAESDAARTRLRRTEFGFVFQSGQLLPELPAEENVALPLLLDGQRPARVRGRARELLALVGLAGMEHRRPGELSGGQAQRVAVARALLSRPGVVFADEPTGSLDQGTGAEVMDLLVRATAAEGSALVVVTHDPTVARRCGRVVTMRDGLVAADHRAPEGAGGRR
ncbi:ABC transporter ATP-binding protein [Auraticoccus monumenti]